MDTSLVDGTGKTLPVRVCNFDTPAPRRKVQMEPLVADQPIIDGDLHGFYVTLGGVSRHFRYSQLMRAGDDFIAGFAELGIDIESWPGYHDLLSISVPNDRGIRIRLRHRGQSYRTGSLLLKRNRCRRRRPRGPLHGTQKSNTWQIAQR